MACLVAKRVSQDDEARLALLLQKLSREWSLLTSVTWDSVGGAFADAIYGGYVIITFAFILGRVFQEIPKGRRILEGVLLGMGMIFFIVLGGLELASLDSVPNNLIVNASVLGTFSLVTAALFLIDLMGPRIYTATHHSQTDLVSHEKVTPSVQAAPNDQVVANGQIPNAKPKDTTEDKSKTEKFSKKEQTVLFEKPKHGYTKFDDTKIEGVDLEKSKFGSVRNDFETGNYIRLSDPLAEPDRLHYERELAKFNENYFRNYLGEDVDNKISIKEDYFPEPQQPLFAKVKSGRLKSLYEDVSPNYEAKRNGKSPTRQRMVNMPTLQQLEDYLRGSSRSRRADTPVAGVFPMEPIEERDRDAEEIDGRASGTPTDPGYVQYAADRWPDKRDAMTPRHSPK
ncbi:hypothetical protein EVAR_20583_1 [Eumeta japonica]|uniref:Uncharacterized protein n=1 Tax=Eumeta variegata TaxID=151549 RepID=A0A4C1USL5_EUMVA|nr:hypothetical protein EVAR_20583_1 [Eumeta japonica]